MATLLARFQHSNSSGPARSQFAFRGGANDADLCRLTQNDDGSFVFPLKENGEPTWLPSAGWFMDQIDVNNGVDWTIKEKEVMFSGEDLLLKIRMAGVSAHDSNPSVS